MAEHDEEAGGRQRYAVVQDAARRLIETLVTDYDVELAEAPPGTSLAGWTDEEVVRLVPLSEDQAELLVSFTPFPGVALRFGRRVEATFPHCGCEDCDEQPDDLIAEMTDLVGKLTSSVLTEWAERSGGVSWGWRLPDDASSSSTSLTDVPDLVDGQWEWQPWTVRG